MSHKLVKNQPEKDGIKKKRLNRVYFICFIVLTICFAAVWISVAMTSAKFDKQLEHMILGKDYFIEDVTIVKKMVDSYSSSELSTHENYFFYYGNEEQEKMQIPHDIYVQYAIGDKIPAYTVNHVSYGYTKESILPREEFRQNELMKCIGVLLGVGIVTIAILYWFHRIT